MSFRACERSEQARIVMRAERVSRSETSMRAGEKSLETGNEGIGNETIREKNI